MAFLAAFCLAGLPVLAAAGQKAENRRQNYAAVATPDDGKAQTVHASTSGTKPLKWRRWPAAPKPKPTLATVKPQGTIRQVSGTEEIPRQPASKPSPPVEPTAAAGPIAPTAVAAPTVPAAPATPTGVAINPAEDQKPAADQTGEDPLASLPRLASPDGGPSLLDAEPVLTADASAGPPSQASQKSEPGTLPAIPETAQAPIIQQPEAAETRGTTDNGPQASCRDLLAELKKTSLRDFKRSDLEYCGETSGKGGKDQQVCQFDAGTHVPRDWDPIQFTWTASALCHRPAYFEQTALERYGHSTGPYTQPLVSAAQFFLTLPILPYKMGLQTPNECVYALGYYRPGSCAPYLLPGIPISARAALFEAGAVVGAAFLLP